MDAPSNRAKRPVGDDRASDRSFAQNTIPVHIDDARARGPGRESKALGANIGGYRARAHGEGLGVFQAHVIHVNFSGAGFLSFLPAQIAAAK